MGRHADGDPDRAPSRGCGWMTYRRISDALLARNRKGSSLDVQAMSKFVQKVREALFFRMKAGTVERELIAPPE